MNGWQPTEDYFCISIDSLWDFLNHTDGEGPLLVGVAHGDYTLAEIEEFIELNFFNPQNKIGEEQSRRLIRKIGRFSGLGVSGELNNGIPIRTRLNWNLNTAGLQPWVYNRDIGALTTGTVVRADMTLYGRWLH